MCYFVLGERQFCVCVSEVCVYLCGPVKGAVIADFEPDAGVVSALRRRPRRRRRPIGAAEDLERPEVPSRPVHQPNCRNWQSRARSMQQTC